MTRPERFVGWLTMKALVWLGKKAVSRGDRHEAEHILVMMMAGDTGRLHVEPCLLTTLMPIAHRERAARVDGEQA